MKDNLVEARQSVRLCNALSGQMLQAVDEELQEVTTLQQVVPCGTDSELQLIKEGQHALDVCLASAFFPTDLCPSGGEASQEEGSWAIADATEFAANLAPDGIDGAGDTNG